MADQNHLITHLLSLVETFDDAAWIALANKGLYRRARKDLEKGISPSLDEVSEHALTIHVADYTVSLPEAGPVKATCSCPAPGLCQHILIACLGLRNVVEQLPAPIDDEASQSLEAEASAEAIVSVEAELLAITHDKLRKWAGSANFRAAIKLVEGAKEPQITPGNPLLITVPALGIECRYWSGTGLDGAVVTGPTRKRQQFMAAAILAFQQFRGLPLPEMPEGSASKVETPRSRQEVLFEVQHLLEEAVTVGLAHLSPGMQERFATLAISAQGVKFYRLSLSLKHIADEVGLLIERKGQANMERLLMSMSRLYALSEALGNAGSTPDSSLVGHPRTQYAEVATLHLIGVGAYAWQTRSGYWGLTLLFWNNEQQEFFSWSDARPMENSGGFTPFARYRGESPWQGGQSPQELCRSVLTLTNGAKNLENRLSGSSKTHVVRRSSTHIQDIQGSERLFDDWSQLAAYAATLAPLGLRRVNPLQEIVFIQPAIWGKRTFDHIQQRFFWWLLDKHNRQLPLILDYSSFTENTIKTLERLKPPKDGSWMLAARIVREQGGFAIQPYSVLKPGDTAEAVNNLGLDSKKQKHWWDFVKHNRLLWHEPEQDWDMSEDEEEPMPTFGNQLDRVMADLDNQCLALAERGIHHLSDLHIQTFETFAKHLQQCGLSTLSAAIQHLLATPETQARHLLTLVFLSHLYRQAAASAKH